MKAYRYFACVAFCFVTMSGCNFGPDLPPTYPVEGSISLDGEMVADATVVFIADQGSYNATGVSDKNGKFVMKAFDTKPGVVAGSYKVELNKTIVSSKEGKGGEADVNLQYGLPKKYSQFNTSGLTITVTEAGNKDLKYELKSK